MPANGNGATYYRWVIGAVVAALFFSIGINVRSYSLKEDVVINTVKIEGIKESLTQINEKLDRLLE